MLPRDGEDRLVDGLRELYGRKEISRRGFLAALAALGITAAGAGALAACGAAAPTATPTTAPKPPSAPTATSAPAAPTKAALAASPTAPSAVSPTAASLKANPTIAAAVAAGRRLIVGDFGGASGACKKAGYYDPWEQATGMKMIQVSPLSYGKIKAMVETKNYEFDVFLSSYQDRAAAEGLLEAIDYTIVKDADQLYPEFKKPYWCSGDLNTVFIVYRKDQFSDPAKAPNSWADFWNLEKFPGGRALHNRAATLLEMALLADGVPGDKLYPLDADRAFKSLDKIKPHIKVWWDYNSQGQSVELIKSGEVSMINLWGSRFNELVKANAPIAKVWNQALIYVAPWTVVKGAPNKDLAMHFVNFSIRPESQAKNAVCMGYGFSNPKAANYVSKEELATLSSNPEYLKLEVPVNFDWWVKNEGPLQERFDAWKMA